MKNLILLFSSILLTTTVLSQTKVFVNYVTHNEDSYNRYIVNKPFYLNTRTMLRQFAIDCRLKEAKWSMGNDFKMLDAILLHDFPPVTADTDGLNFLKWLKDSMDVELDAHAHAQFGYPSLADVAYKHTLLGVDPSSVISGYLLNEADGNGNWWFDYESPVASNIDPTYTYFPEILWGAANKGHVGDPLHYGIWKPTDTSNYFLHDTTKRLINYGNGCRIKITDTTTVEEVLETVDSLLAGIERGRYPRHGFYQISLFIAEYHFWDDLVAPPDTYSFDGDFLTKVNQITDSINTRVTAGKMKWMHIEDIVHKWKTSYDSRPFNVECDYRDTVRGAPPKTLAPEEYNLLSEFNIYPIPTNDLLNITCADKKVNYNLSIYTINGQLIYRKENIFGDYRVSLGGHFSGVYLINLTTNENNYTTKFILH